METAKLLVDLLRIASTIAQALKTFTETASPEALKAFVAEVHAAGGTVDLQTVDKVVADMKASGEALDAKIKAAGG